MKAVVLAYSRQGCRTAREIQAARPEDRWQAYTMERFGEPGFSVIRSGDPSFYGELFAEAELMVFVGSCGIAVRSVAPFVNSKKTDPAVLCVDDMHRYVIPLLSGHIGGANAAARELAAKLGAQAVVTTATDIHKKFSADAWAAANGYAVSSLERVKEVSAAILERDVPLCSDIPVSGSLPGGTTAEETGLLGIYITWTTREPFERTLRLIPRCLHLGIGCRKGTPEETIRRAVEEVLAEHELDVRAVRAIASIDLKREEAGLLAYAGSRQLELNFYTAEELREVPGDFAASEFVKSITGVDNVCERAAMLRSDRLLVGKTARNGVTVAVGAEDLEVRFE